MSQLGYKEGMSTYAIGDIQGCLDDLLQLLEQIQFDEQRDTLWFTGDLVNRGPKSLETLRFIKGLPNVVTVLGNHDLTLLAIAYANHPPSSEHNMDDILNAPDRDELLSWLSSQPLAHYDPDLDYFLVHAGIPPNWSAQETLTRAQEVEAALSADSMPEFMDHLHGNEPDQWDQSLSGWDRLRYIVNALTRMRFVDEHCRQVLDLKGPIASQPDLIPWFEHPERVARDTRILFGHWAALEGVTNTENVFALDTGAVWGGKLTAKQLD